MEISDKAVTRWTGTIYLAIGLAVAYWVWPDGITNLTLTNITFGAFLRAAASGAIGVATLSGATLLWME